MRFSDRFPWVVLAMIFAGCISTPDEENSGVSYQDLGESYSTFSPIFEGTYWEYAVHDSGAEADAVNYQRRIGIESADTNGNTIQIRFSIRDSGQLCPSTNRLCPEPIGIDSRFFLDATVKMDTPSLSISDGHTSNLIQFFKYNAFSRNVYWEVPEGNVRHEVLQKSDSGVHVVSLASSMLRLSSFHEHVYRQNVGLIRYQHSTCLIGLCTILKYVLTAHGSATKP